MNKRGQITIFIILGIVLVTVLAWLFFLGGLNIKEKLSYEEAERFVSARVEPVSSLVEGCVEESAWIVLRTMGKFGGYVVPQFSEANPTIELLMPTGDISNINYVAYYDDSGFVNNFYSVGEMRNEFETYLENIALDQDDSLFAECINNFDAFRDDFDGIEYSDLDVEVEFGKKIRMIINYPVTLSRSDYETTIEQYYVELPVNMREIHSVGSKLVNDVYLGNSLIDTRSYYIGRYTDELSSGAREDSVGISWYDTESFDTGRNNIHNYFFSLNYAHPELENEYIFNLLVGAGE